MEVFRARWIPRARRLRESFENSLPEQDTPSPRDLVRALALAFLEGPLTDEERLRHHQLIAREMALPTEAFGLLTQQVMRPFFRELADRLRPVLPENMGGEHLMLNIMSIFAMVLHFNFGREAVSRIMGRAYDPEFKQKLVEHIIGFSLRGMGWGDEEGIP
jgi:hypothetical protein